MTGTRSTSTCLAEERDVDDLLALADDLGDADAAGLDLAFSDLDLLADDRDDGLVAVVLLDDPGPDGPADGRAGGGEFEVRGAEGQPMGAVGLQGEGVGRDDDEAPVVQSDRDAAGAARHGAIGGHQGASQAVAALDDQS